ncbi:MAG: hypothetical protein JOZ58_06200 [Acetobacteraceae bacterium]|nr:hypothetical protein [Acetobacteraceae bacterium]
MAHEIESEPDGITPANDNQGPEDGPEREAWRRGDSVALTLARIIGRRMAREDFAARIAANDNRPVASEKSEGEVDKD